MVGMQIFLEYTYKRRNHYTNPTFSSFELKHSTLKKVLIPALFKMKNIVLASVFSVILALAHAAPTTTLAPGVQGRMFGLGLGVGGHVGIGGQVGIGYGHAGYGHGGYGHGRYGHSNTGHSGHASGTYNQGSYERGVYNQGAYQQGHRGHASHGHGGYGHGGYGHGSHYGGY